MMSDIVFEGVSKHFRYGLKRHLVLQNLSISVKQGEIFGFLGANGAGKSTSINIALDFIRPDTGQVLIKNIPSSNPLSRSFIGYMPEHPQLYEQLTPKELLGFSGSVTGMGTRKLRENAESILEKLELLSFINRPVRTFSKGMKQRVGLAMATIHDPDILILDEPMSGLDPLGRHLVSNLILEFKQNGKTIFFSSHILNDVETLCDSIAVIHKGRSLYAGDVKGFRNDFSNLEEAFIARISSEADVL